MNMVREVYQYKARIRKLGERLKRVRKQRNAAVESVARLQDVVDGYRGHRCLS